MKSVLHLHPVYIHKYITAPGDLVTLLYSIQEGYSIVTFWCLLAETLKTAGTLRTFSSSFYKDISLASFLLLLKLLFLVYLSNWKRFIQKGILEASCFCSTGIFLSNWKRFVQKGILEASAFVALLFCFSIFFVSFRTRLEPFTS